MPVDGNESYFVTAATTSSFLPHVCHHSGAATSTTLGLLLRLFSNKD